MDNLWYDLFLAFFSAILGALFGVVIPKLLKDKKEIQGIYINKQLIFTDIHIEQKKYIVDNAAYKKENGAGKSRGTSGGEIFWGYLLVALFLVFFFLKYERQISAVVLCAFVFIETAFLTTAFVTVKKYYVDRAIKSILLFNIFATTGVPILLYFVNNPIVGMAVNKQEVLHQAEKSGILSLLFDVHVFGFLLYQAVGVIFLVGFMAYTLVGLMHVLSMINLTLKKRFGKMWAWIFRKTLGFCKSPVFYIFFGSFLLIVSFLFVSGVLSMLISQV